MRVLSGIQPTNVLHIGNWFGAISLWETELKNSVNAEGIFFIADLHALTVPHDPQELKNGTYFILSAYLSAGLDPKKHIIFAQSHNEDHPYLGWILETQTPIGWLERMTQFKDKKKKLLNYNKVVSAGLFTYPTLMASDILLYDANIVPVGDDQIQHVELARDIAKRMNKIYGELFVVPKAKKRKFGARIKDLQNPLNKMSKSSESTKGVIFLTDADEVIVKKIKSAVTDSDGQIYFDPINKPGVSNLLTIFSLVTGDSVETIVQKYQGGTYAVFKQDLADAVVEYIKPIRDNLNKYVSDKGYLDSVLKDGVIKAKEISSAKINKVREKLGFV